MTVSLDIFSDPICPWCLIGKTRLDAALDARPTHPFEITWRPFMLNPAMPPEGMDRKTYLERKFGGPQRAADVYGAIAETAAAEGLDVRLDAITRTPSTLDAHRLLRWAAAEDAQDGVVDALFDMYFRQARDISERSALLEAAERGGMTVAVVDRLLNSDADIREVMDEDADARAAGMRGAPSFVIAGRHVVPGAQPTDLWLNVIDDIGAGALA